jgi:hypothetical protein
VKQDGQDVDVDAILAQDDLVDGALRKAARHAVRQHWAAGFPVAEWRNGRVVWVGPDGRVSDRPYLVRKRKP